MILVDISFISAEEPLILVLIFVLLILVGQLIIHVCIQFFVSDIGSWQILLAKLPLKNI